MASKTIKTVWYCPCSCTTPKGMLKKFYKNNKLIEHIMNEHTDKLDTKFLYRLKSDKNPATTKKRSHEEVEEDGFKELLSVEEDEEFRQSEEDISDIINATASMNLKLNYSLRMSFERIIIK